VKLQRCVEQRPGPDPREAEEVCRATTLSRLSPMYHRLCRIIHQQVIYQLGRIIDLRMLQSVITKCIRLLSVITLVTFEELFTFSVCCLVFILFLDAIAFIENKLALN